MDVQAKEGLVEGGKLASESFLHVRTIVSLGLERHIIDKYDATLRVPYRKALVRAQVQGVSYGFSQVLPYSARHFDVSLRSFTEGGDVLRGRGGLLRGRLLRGDEGDGL